MVMVEIDWRRADLNVLKREGGGGRDARDGRVVRSVVVFYGTRYKYACNGHEVTPMGGDAA